MPQDRSRRRTFRLDGQRLMEEREARDSTDAHGKKIRFTQEDMVDLIGIGLSSYQRAERGECIDARIVEKIKYKLELDDTQLGVRPCTAAPAPPADTRIYLKQLHRDCEFIRVEGLLQQGKIAPMPIHKVYMDLRAAGSGERKAGMKPDGDNEAPKLFEEIREGRHIRWAVIAEAGMGKTTLLKRIAFDQSYAGKNNARFPVLIRIAELEDFIGRRVREGSENLKANSPEWFVRFLEDRSRDEGWGLDRAFFPEKLGDAATLILLDGLDEVGSAERRSAVGEMFSEAARTWRDASFVVTRRPLPESEKLLGDFRTVRVAELDDAAMDKFLGDWLSLGDFSDRDVIAQKETLLGAIRRSGKIRKMARNPLMLTAMAVIHVNENKRLPEARAELYQEILGWLARSREKPGRPHGNTLLDIYSTLAFGMHRRTEGNIREIDRAGAAKLIAGEFLTVPEGDREAAAAAFLDTESSDSGIIVDRGAIGFWHLTFQEFCAARYCTGFDSPAGELIRNGWWLLPGWREVMVLLPGVLRLNSQRERANSFFNTVLEHAEKDASPAVRARVAGLVGNALQDMRPLGYVLPDESRYRRLLEEALGAADLAVRVEAAEALGQAGDPRLKENNWVPISPGTFLMGAQKTRKGKPGYDPEAGDNEGPPREVTLKNVFQIGRCPITVEEFQPFVEDEDGYRSLRWWTNGGFSGRDAPREWDEQLLYPNRPVVSVDWYEAFAYCLWATAQLPDRSPWKTVRLPTEEEWEFVARGKEGRRYPWGDTPPDATRANYNETRIGRAAPVGLFPGGNTPDGVADMAGNVWEWTSSNYDKASELKVLRGASFINFAGYLRAAIRDGLEPDSWSVYFGFRCVRE